MLNLISIELYKIFSKPRSYIGFGAITAIVVLIEFALWLDGKSYLSFILQSLEQSFQVEGNILNGNLVCFIILQTLIVQMPLLVALITGDLVSGEAATGTIRLVLTKPFSRGQLLWAKYAAGCTYTFMLLLWLGVLALCGGLLIFGAGDMIVLKSDGLTIIRGDDTLWRYLGAFSIAFLSLVVVATFSMMLSCFTDNSIGPIISSMAVIILFTIIGTLDVPFFDKLKPFLFTTHMIVWRNMFDNPLDTSQIVQSLVILSGHIVVFFSVAYYHFTRKDILN